MNCFTIRTPTVADDIVKELLDWQYIVDETQGKATVIMLSGNIFGDAAKEIKHLRADRDEWKAKYFQMRIQSMKNTDQQAANNPTND